jgi:hypothetical protein
VLAVVVLNDLPLIELRVELHAEACSEIEHVVVVWIGDPTGAKVEHRTIDVDCLGAAADAILRIKESNGKAPLREPLRLSRGRSASRAGNKDKAERAP